MRKFIEYLQLKTLKQDIMGATLYTIPTDPGNNAVKTSRKYLLFSVVVS